MPLILGIDPGSRKTGYGVISAMGGRLEYITSGIIRMQDQHTLAERLKIIFDGITQIIDLHLPQEFAIEQVFMAKSAGSALKLGQARGAAIVAAVGRDLPVAEYEARKIKQSLVGTGAADKIQVQHMVKILLKLTTSPAEDAADALAVAICHANTQASLIRMAGARSKSMRYRRGRLS